MKPSVPFARRWSWKLVTALWLTVTITAAVAYPIELPAQLGQMTRNIFFHVPVDIATTVAFVVSLWASVQTLRTGSLDADLRAASAAQVGFLFCILALLTGSWWATFAWGAFWTADPRQISILVLLLIYGAYFALRSALDGAEKRARLSAVYNLFAGITMPFFIFVVPRITKSRHPGGALSKGEEVHNPVIEAIAPETRIILYAAMLGFLALLYWLYTLRVRIGRLEPEAQAEVGSVERPTVVPRRVRLES